MKYNEAARLILAVIVTFFLFFVCTWRVADPEFNSVGMPGKVFAFMLSAGVAVTLGVEVARHGE